MVQPVTVYHPLNGCALSYFIYIKVSITKFAKIQFVPFVNEVRFQSHFKDIRVLSFTDFYRKFPLNVCMGSLLEVSICFLSARWSIGVLGRINLCSMVSSLKSKYLFSLK